MDNEIRDIIQNIDPDDLEGLSKLVPYVKQAISAYQWVKQKRMTLFLKTLAKSEENLTEYQKEKLQKILSSEDGKELLAEYADSVIRTSSRTGIAALAILYGDVDDKKFRGAFKSLAALSLEGISEEAVDLFLALSEGQRFSKLVDDKGPYKIYFCDNHFLSYFPDLNYLLNQPAEIVAITNDLIRRRLLVPDHAYSRIGGGEVSIPFGLSETSILFQKLLKLAREFTSTNK